MVALGVVVQFSALAVHANSVAWVGVVTAVVGVVGLVGHSVFGE